MLFDIQALGHGNSVAVVVRQLIRALTAAPVLVVYLVACGGQTEPRDERGSTSVGDDGGGGGWGTTPLPECKQGVPRGSNPENPCEWIADGLCYETKEAACACICPRERRSVCVSSFGGGGGVEVQCF